MTNFFLSLLALAIIAQIFLAFASSPFGDDNTAKHQVKMRIVQDALDP